MIELLLFVLAAALAGAGAVISLSTLAELHYWFTEWLDDQVYIMRKFRKSSLINEIGHNFKYSHGQKVWSLDREITVTVIDFIAYNEDPDRNPRNTVLAYKVCCGPFFNRRYFTAHENKLTHLKNVQTISTKEHNALY